MALRQINERGEEILSKKCKPVKEITPRIVQLCNDMVETMKEADGVGLAAPQVGVMKRIFVAMPHAAAEDDETRDKVYHMINPEIISTEGEQASSEGCLSVPGYIGLVDRPMKVRIKAMDLDGKYNEYEFEGFEATVMCHENDHLNGVLYCDIAKDFMTIEEYNEKLEAFKKENEEQEQSVNKNDIPEDLREKNGL